MNKLDIVLEVYRDAFGIRSDKANETHKEACIEVARLRVIEEAVWKLAEHPDSEEKKRALLKLIGVEI